MGKMEKAQRENIINWIVNPFLRWEISAAFLQTTKCAKINKKNETKYDRVKTICLWISNRKDVEKKLKQEKKNDWMQSW